MVLPVHRRYEIIFYLNIQWIYPKLSHADVAKAVKCDVTTMKYWLRLWKQANDLNDSIRSGRPWGTTTKQNEQVVSLAEQQTFVTARDMANKVDEDRSYSQRENDITAPERSRSQIQSTFIEVIAYRSTSKKSFKMGSR